jgi:hypothetical protein
MFFLLFRTIFLFQASLSSEPFGQNLEDEEGEGEGGGDKERVLSDGLLQTFTDHEVSRWRDLKPSFSL